LRPVPAVPAWALAATCVANGRATFVTSGPAAVAGTPLQSASLHLLAKPVDLGAQDWYYETFYGVAEPRPARERRCRERVAVR
jgi:hypothetical protein